MSALDKMVITTKNGKRTAAIPCLEILGDSFANSLPTSESTFDDIVQFLHRETISVFRTKDPTLPLPTGSAFSNCNGKWTEYVFAVFAWNALAHINSNDPDNSYVYVKMPTNSSAINEWIALLETSYLNHLSSFSRDRRDPKVAITSHQALLLCSSNPDAVILKFSKAALVGLPLCPDTALTDLSMCTIIGLDSVFAKLTGQVVPFDNLCCFLSMKNSMRPDRRYQFVHEGDNIKAILLHLIGRRLDPRLELNFLQNKYYGLSFNAINDKDIRAMDTAMVACLTNPAMDPIWSVDRLFPCLSISEVDNIINEVLN